MAILKPDLPTQLVVIQTRLQNFDEAMAEVPANVRQIKADLQKIKSEIAVMRAVVTDHSYELKAYGERLRDLERTY